MDLKWEVSRSDSKPDSVDFMSSKTTTYINRNIEKITVQDPDGNDVELWQFEQCKLTKDQYARLMEEINGSNQQLLSSV